LVPGNPKTTSAAKITAGSCALGASVASTLPRTAVVVINRIYRTNKQHQIELYRTASIVLGWFSQSYIRGFARAARKRQGAQEACAHFVLVCSKSITLFHYSHQPFAQRREFAGTFYGHRPRLPAVPADRGGPELATARGQCAAVACFTSTARSQSGIRFSRSLRAGAAGPPPCVASPKRDDCNFPEVRCYAYRAQLPLNLGWVFVPLPPFILDDIISSVQSRDCTYSCELFLYLNW
jgi:hypothetical protein